MRLGLLFYRAATLSVTPFLPVLFYHRLRNGKEIRKRKNERFARALPQRPVGELVWVHGASLGECRLALSLIEALQTDRPGLHALITCQTLSAAKMVSANLPPNTIHQMAPVDTLASARRFLDHWQPDLCILTESEIWPNLLAGAHKRGVPTALVNARMTETSCRRWYKFARSGRKLFSALALIHATDAKTASLLSDLSGQPVPPLKNLKIGAAAPSFADHASIPPFDKFTESKTAGHILLGASTHRGEEALLIKAFQNMPAGSRLILAPRHTDRAKDISKQLRSADIEHGYRSNGGHLSDQTPVLIVDTFGEMDRWYHAADHIYLGGGHRPGIGGHNPLEPLSFRKPILSGPHTTNFIDLFDHLSQTGWITTVRSDEDILHAITVPNRADNNTLDSLIESGKEEFDALIRRLSALMGTRAT